MSLMSVTARTPYQTLLKMFSDSGKGPQILAEALGHAFSMGVRVSLRRQQLVLGGGRDEKILTVK